MTTRQHDSKQHEPTQGSKKVQTMPAPGGKKMMMMPPPARFGSTGRSSQSVSFNNIIYLAAQLPSDVSKDIKGQTQEVCQAIDKLLQESMSDKTKIIRADIFLKDKSMMKEVQVCL